LNKPFLFNVDSCISGEVFKVQLITTLS
jgi:hypothetical protein